MVDKNKSIFLEIKDDYCTGNYTNSGGGENWIEVDELPTKDITELKAHKKLADGTLEFDAEKYQSILESKEILTQEAMKTTRITELQKQLYDTDYKVIKCYEYSLIGLELPYDMETLHAERQVIRDEINNLEGGEADE